jgi:methyl-accepting chemotaxis protein
MRTFFIKMFVWFGLAMLIVNVGSFVTGAFVISRRLPRPGTGGMAQMFSAFAQTAIDTFEKEGRPGLTSYLDRMEGTSQINGIAIDDHRNELSGRSLANGTKEFAQRVVNASGFLIEFPSGRARPLVGTPVRASNGALYVVVAELSRSDFPGPPRLGQPGSLRFGLLVAGQTLLPLLLIGTLFSYLLARHLSTPIEELRGATHQLSEGNLSARVDQRLLKRHDEIGYLGRDFNLMAKRVESLVEAQRRLLGDISHELRSPWRGSVLLWAWHSATVAAK